MFSSLYILVMDGDTLLGYSDFYYLIRKAQMLMLTVKYISETIK